MAKINPCFFSLPKKYLFSRIGEKVASEQKKDKNAKIINLGVGDIALPLSEECALGVKRGAEAMTRRPYGYGPCEGFTSLRARICEIDYPFLGISPDEIFVSDGINSSLCGFSELFPVESLIGIPQPTYPLYRDMNLLDGKHQITYLPCTEETGFMPHPPKERLDIVYLCSPANPMGVAMPRILLQQWVDWAIHHKAILLFDAAYAGFIRSSDVPKTIYEIPGSEKVAIEFKSFSKSAGFTGLRLGYTVVPKSVLVLSEEGEVPLHPFWYLRQDIKTNGVSYPVQEAGLAALSEKGLAECKEEVDWYLTAAKKMKNLLVDLGQAVYGGEDAPYLWVKLNALSSWEAFDLLLEKFHIATIPGSGFGPLGEGFLRISSFVTPENLEIVLSRLSERNVAHAL